MGSRYRSWITAFMKHNFRISITFYCIHTHGHLKIVFRCVTNITSLIQIIFSKSTTQGHKRYLQEGDWVRFHYSHTLLLMTHASLYLNRVNDFYKDLEYVKCNKQMVWWKLMTGLGVISNDIVWQQKCGRVALWGWYAVLEASKPHGNNVWQRPPVKLHVWRQ